LLQPIYNVGLSLIFEWGIALYDLEVEKAQAGEKPWKQVRREAKNLWRKARKQLAKDYVLFPLLSGPGFLATLTANATANAVRNMWSHAVIFCGHFPDGTETFEEERLEGETKGQWYVRQLLGSANLSGGPLFHIMTGNLSHQIEHHLFPDIPSNRYAEIAPRVREICERYGLPYTTGSLPKQYGTVVRKLARLAFPGGGRRARRSASRGARRFRGTWRRRATCGAAPRRSRAPACVAARPLTHPRPSEPLRLLRQASAGARRGARRVARAGSVEPRYRP